MTGDLKYHIAKWSGIPRLMNFCNRNHLLVLAYHGIFDGPEKTGLYPSTFIHLDNLVRQLRYIKNNYRIISPAELTATLENKATLPPYSALITFDDGYESFGRLAVPVLRSLDIKAIVFIATEYVEQNVPFWFDLAWHVMMHAERNTVEQISNAVHLTGVHTERSQATRLFLQKIKEMKKEDRNRIIEQITRTASKEIRDRSHIMKSFYSMTPQDVRELTTSGISFGGHTHSHTILTSIPFPEAENELVLNKQKIEDMTCSSCDFFAYPNGSKSDFHDQHKVLLKKIGYKCAFSLTGDRSTIQSDVMDIPRFNVAPEDSELSLQVRITGFNRYFTNLKRSSRN
jgi:peptidoglycan/xylan/chitin deacetylase (PgdA/CDA1 family)